MATRTAHIKVTNIDWDVNDEEDEFTDKDLDLPGIVILTLKDVNDDDDMDDIIADRLSDKYGFCVNSFEWEEICK